jgi:hypothetical protein
MNFPVLPFLGKIAQSFYIIVLRRMRSGQAVAFRRSSLREPATGGTTRGARLIGRLRD